MRQGFQSLSDCRTLGVNYSGCIGFLDLGIVYLAFGFTRNPPGNQFPVS